jgi:ribonuclease VapC
MSEVVIDASALLALLNSEPGSDVVAEALPEAVISAVNLSEVVAKLCGAGIPESSIRHVLEPLGVQVKSFDESNAYQAGMLRADTKSSGISLGNRACLSLAKTLGVVALTADKTWTSLSVGATVKLIR